MSHTTELRCFFIVSLFFIKFYSIENQWLIYIGIVHFWFNCFFLCRYFYYKNPFTCLLLLFFVTLQHSPLQSHAHHFTKKFQIKRISWIYPNKNLSCYYLICLNVYFSIKNIYQEKTKIFLSHTSYTCLKHLQGFGNKIL